MNNVRDEKSPEKNKYDDNLIENNDNSPKYNHEKEIKDIFMNNSQSDIDIFEKKCIQDVKNKKNLKNNQKFFISRTFYL